MKTIFPILGKKAGLPAFLFLFGLLGSPGGLVAQGLPQRAIKDGIQVEFDLEHLAPGLPSQTFQEGENVRFTFRISDTATGMPVSGAYPAAWMQLDESPEATGDQQCREKIQTFLGGGIFGRPDLDLNVYYVIALNEDPTISVVDPIFGYGGSKLLAMISLHARGKDWALSRDKTRLFVTTPEAREIAVIETNTWQIAGFISLENLPDRAALQPDGHYLWVAYQAAPDDPRGSSGVAVINTASLEIAALIPTGAGAHDVAIDDDNRYAFVSNYDQSTITVIDIRTLQKKADIPTAAGPGFLAWSKASKVLYATHQTDGSVSCIDVNRMSVRSRQPAAPGITRIRFAPDGRLGFIVNPVNNYLYILDAATDKIIQKGIVETAPDQVVFSDQLAYIRHRGSEIVLMAPLAAVGQEGSPIPVVDFPGGDNPPGQTPFPPLADGIAQTPGANAVVVANPLDQSIYFYKEGMAAPMGSFSNYGHRPLAVMVLDRSLKETAPGCYQTIARLNRPGRYCLAFFMDAPRLGHCFELEVAGEGDIALQRTMAEQGPLKVTPLFQERTVSAGQDVLLRFALHPHNEPKPITGLPDVQLLYLTNSGQWSRRTALAEHAQVPGVYETTIQFPFPGLYFLYVSSVSQGLTFNNPQYLLINVMDSHKD